MALTVGDVLPFATEVRAAPVPPATVGVLANAGTMTLAVTRDDGVAVTGSPFTVTPTSTGLYDKDITSAAPATRYRGYWLATGVNSGAHTQVFVVDSPADSGLVSLADVKEHLNLDADVTTHDDELELMIAGATETVEDRCGPVVPRTVTNEPHYGGGDVWLYQAPGKGGDPYITLTSVLPVAGGTGVTVALLTAAPSGRVTYLDGTTSFPAAAHWWTYVAGRRQVPAKLRLAALNYIKGSWSTQRGASGLPLQGPDDFAEQPGMGLVVARLELDLKPYRKLPGTA